MPIVLALACALVYGVADYCGGRATRSAASIAISLIGQVCSGVLALAAVVVLGTRFPPSHDLVWGAVSGAAGAVALADQADRNARRAAGGAPTAIVGQVCSGVLALAAVVVLGTHFPPSRDLVWGAVSGAAGAVALAAFYSALSHGAMTVVAPITAVTSAVLPVAFGLIRGERPGGLAYLGMVLAVAAVALVSGAIGARHVATRRSTIVFALVGGLGFAVIFIALGETSKGSGAWPLVAARVVSVTALVAVALLQRTPTAGVRGVWRLAALAGVLDMSANFLYLLAVQRGLLSIVVVVVALYPVSTVCLAFGLDGERVSRSQMIGLAMAVAALALVSASGAA